MQQECLPTCYSFSVYQKFGSVGSSIGLTNIAHENNCTQFLALIWYGGCKLILVIDWG